MVNPRDIVPESPADSEAPSLTMSKKRLLLKMVDDYGSWSDSEGAFDDDDDSDSDIEPPPPDMDQELDDEDYDDEEDDEDDEEEIEFHREVESDESDVSSVYLDDSEEEDEDEYGDEEGDFEEGDFMVDSEEEEEVYLDEEDMAGRDSPSSDESPINPQSGHLTHMRDAIERDSVGVSKVRGGDDSSSIESDYEEFGEDDADEPAVVLIKERQGTPPATSLRKRATERKKKAETPANEPETSPDAQQAGRRRHHSSKEAPSQPPPPVSDDDDDDEDDEIIQLVYEASQPPMSATIPVDAGVDAPPAEDSTPPLQDAILSEDPKAKSSEQMDIIPSDQTMDVEMENVVATKQGSTSPPARKTENMVRDGAVTPEPSGDIQRMTTPSPGNRSIGHQEPGSIGSDFASPPARKYDKSIVVKKKKKPHVENEDVVPASQVSESSPASGDIESMVRDGAVTPEPSGDIQRMTTPSPGKRSVGDQEPESIGSDFVSPPARKYDKSIVVKKKKKPNVEVKDVVPTSQVSESSPASGDVDTIVRDGVVTPEPSGDIQRIATPSPVKRSAGSQQPESSDEELESPPARMYDKSIVVKKKTNKKSKKSKSPTRQTTAEASIRVPEEEWREPQSNDTSWYEEITLPLKDETNHPIGYNMDEGSHGSKGPIDSTGIRRPHQGSSGMKPEPIHSGTGAPGVASHTLSVEYADLKQGDGNQKRGRPQRSRSMIGGNTGRSRSTSADRQSPGSRGRSHSPELQKDVVATPKSKKGKGYRRYIPIPWSSKKKEKTSHNASLASEAVVDDFLMPDLPGNRPKLPAVPRLSSNSLLDSPTPVARGSFASPKPKGGLGKLFRPWGSKPAEVDPLPYQPPPFAGQAKLKKTNKKQETLSVSELREQRRQQYLEDVKRRESIRIQAVMRGYMARRKYPLPETKTKKNTQEVKNIDPPKSPMSPQHDAAPVFQHPQSPASVDEPPPTPKKSLRWLPWAKPKQKKMGHSLSSESLDSMDDPVPLRPAPQVPKYDDEGQVSVAELRERRMLAYQKDVQRREALKIQAAIRGYMVRKNESKPKRKKKHKHKHKHENDANKEHLSKSNHSTGEDAAGWTAADLRPQSFAALSPPTQKPKFPSTTDLRPESYAQRPLVFRNDFKAEGKPLPKGSNHSIASDIDIDRSFKPQSYAQRPMVFRNDFVPASPPSSPAQAPQQKKSMRWLPWVKKSESTHSLGVEEQKKPLDGQLSFDRSLYLRKRMYQDEKEQQTKSLEEIRAERRQMYLRDLERREALKVQAVARGFLVRLKYGKSGKKKKKRSSKKHTLSTISEKESSKEKKGTSGDHNVPLLQYQAGFDRSDYLSERLQREEDERRTKSVAEIREERRQIYLQDLERREATKIQAAFRGYMVRVRYIVRSRQRRIDSEQRKRESMSVVTEDESVNEATSKTQKSVGSSLKRFFFGKPKLKPIERQPSQDEPPVVEEALIFEEPTYTNENDFFGFIESRYKERTGFFDLGSGSRQAPDVTPHGYAQTEEARNWTGRKKKVSSKDFDKNAYWRERKALEEYESGARTMAEKRVAKQKAAQADKEKREATKIQALVRGFLVRKSLRKLAPKDKNQRNVNTLKPDAPVSAATEPSVTKSPGQVADERAVTTPLKATPPSIKPKNVPDSKPDMATTKSDDKQSVGATVVARESALNAVQSQGHDKYHGKVGESSVSKGTPQSTAPSTNTVIPSHSFLDDSKTKNQDPAGGQGSVPVHLRSGQMQNATKPKPIECSQKNTSAKVASHGQVVTSAAGTSSSPDPSNSTPVANALIEQATPVSRADPDPFPVADPAPKKLVATQPGEKVVRRVVIRKDGTKVVQIRRIRRVTPDGTIKVPSKAAEENQGTSNRIHGRGLSVSTPTTSTSMTTTHNSTQSPGPGYLVEVKSSVDVDISEDVSIDKAYADDDGIKKSTTKRSGRKPTTTKSKKPVAEVGGNPEDPEKGYHDEGDFTDSSRDVLDESWWLPKFGTVDTNIYRQDVYVPEQPRPYDEYRRSPKKASTTSYWEIVRDRYLPSGLGLSGGDNSVTFVPTMYASKNPELEEISTTQNQAADVSWVPRGDLDLQSVDVSATTGDTSESKWAPRTLGKQRSQRIDFSGVVNDSPSQSRNNSFRWAPHLSNNNEKSLAVRMVYGEIPAETDVLDVESPPEIDLEEGLQREIVEEDKVIRAPSNPGARCKTMLVCLLILCIIGGGIIAAFFFWADAPWEDWF
eukprot:Nitzschia sp. Nitz4//scaffold228_size32365//8653//15330//NITZ4_007905-RA/size32365-processed-gene-0.32-mRNA-1//1//CDS//3329542816//4351//frame0